MVVVFPVPGPPVSTRMPLLAASITAVRCMSSRYRPVFSSIACSRFIRLASATSQATFRSWSIFATFISI